MYRSHTGPCWGQETLLYFAPPTFKIYNSLMHMPISIYFKSHDQHMHDLQSEFNPCYYGITILWEEGRGILGLSYKTMMCDYKDLYHDMFKLSNQILSSRWNIFHTHLLVCRWISELFNQNLVLVHFLYLRAMLCTSRLHHSAVARYGIYTIHRLSALGCVSHTNLHVPV